MLADTGATVLELVSLETRARMRLTNVSRRHVSIMQRVSTSLRFVDCHFIVTIQLQYALTRLVMWHHLKIARQCCVHVLARQ